MKTRETTKMTPEYLVMSKRDWVAKMTSPMQATERAQTAQSAQSSRSPKRSLTRADAGGEEDVLDLVEGGDHRGHVAQRRRQQAQAHVVRRVRPPEDGPGTEEKGGRI